MITVNIPATFASHAAIYEPSSVHAITMLRDALRTGGQMNFTAPPGMGKSLIVCEAIKDIPGPICSIARLREFSDQFHDLCDRCEVTNVVHLRALRRSTIAQSVKGFTLVIAQECMRDIAIDHPNVLRLA